MRCYDQSFVTDRHVARQCPHLIVRGHLYLSARPTLPVMPSPPPQPAPDAGRLRALAEAFVERGEAERVRAWVTTALEGSGWSARTLRAGAAAAGGGRSASEIASSVRADALARVPDDVRTRLLRECEEFVRGVE